MTRPLHALEPVVRAEVLRLLESRRVPGAAVAVVLRGRDELLVHGVKDVVSRDPVTPATAFDVGSCAKSYVSAAVGLLVQDGAVSLDDPIGTFVPEMVFDDPWVSAHATLRDLLANRSGLARVRPIEAFPDISAVEMLSRVRHLPRAKPFRSGYVYNNLGFVACALTVERVSGIPYAEFLHRRLFDPLGMTASASGSGALSTIADRALGHAGVGRPLTPLAECAFDNTQGAGSVYSSGEDALKWLRFQLAGASGKATLDQRLLAELHRPHTVMQREETSLMHRPPDAPHCAYALGWISTELGGRRIVQHSGGMFGWFAHVALAPDEGVGVAVYLNARREVHHAIAYTVLERLLGLEPHDWGAIAARQAEKSGRDFKNLVEGLYPVEDGVSSVRPLGDYEGRYDHPAAGGIEIERSEGGLLLKQLDGRLWDLALESVGGDVFRARFLNAAIAEYAPTGFRVRFEVDRGRIVALDEPAARYRRCP
jgi:CubicO group peptidase (beta-lactamase class C family)